MTSSEDSLRSKHRHPNCPKYSAIPLPGAKLIQPGAISVAQAMERDSRGTHAAVLCATIYNYDKPRANPFPRSPSKAPLRQVSENVLSCTYLSQDSRHSFYHTFPTYWYQQAFRHPGCSSVNHTTCPGPPSSYPPPPQGTRPRLLCLPGTRITRMATIPHPILP